VPQRARSACTRPRRGRHSTPAPRVRS